MQGVVAALPEGVRCRQQSSAELATAVRAETWRFGRFLLSVKGCYVKFRPQDDTMHGLLPHSSNRPHLFRKLVGEMEGAGCPSDLWRSQSGTHKLSHDALTRNVFIGLEIWDETVRDVVLVCSQMSVQERVRDAKRPRRDI